MIPDVARWGNCRGPVSPGQGTPSLAATMFCTLISRQGRNKKESLIREDTFLMENAGGKNKGKVMPCKGGCMNREQPGSITANACAMSTTGAMSTNTSLELFGSNIHKHVHH
mmetsp:Transcript_11985/g.33227  ORF Transcript_11985/g.33227 Transcript_11985/m.33227 type:complete len:112 (+) Transcript_11985:191-526(+)